MDLQSINASIIKECAKELQMPVVRKEAQTKKQAFSQKKEKKGSKKNSKSGSFKLKVAAIVLIALAWGMAGYSFYRAKIGKPILSEFMLNLIEKNDYTSSQQGKFL